MQKVYQVREGVAGERTDNSLHGGKHNKVLTSIYNVKNGRKRIPVNNGKVAKN